MYLVVGLGNPGSEYKNSRHNIGCHAINTWRRNLGVRLTGCGFQSKKARVTYKDQKVILLRPLTFMNRSGYAVKACADHYDIESEDILVIHDDLDLPVGRLKAVRGSSAGGHRGVQSIIDHMGNTRFRRVKIGIGRPRYGEAVEDYVLAPFYEDEKDVIQKVLGLATLACELFVSDGIEPTMNIINCQNLSINDQGGKPIGV